MNNAIVLARSTYLWIAAGLIFGFTLFAGSTGSLPLIKGALIANGVFALLGIAFGVWTGRKVARR
ncbi:hypothetical protein [Sphingomonas sp. Y38-1Y]|uniref:hypothetical protein n=1 Tax=Sphingomonas sp. Y38-1Y TaxID=3078265 RepID=UPI0028ED8FE2|nr:hypothetical protein [Sphingomonas sp. Y38-1Y]